MNTSAIQHHGIKGQKWGVRRFQNEDGSLTDAGKERRKVSVTITKDPKRLAAAALMLGTAAVLSANIGTLSLSGAEWWMERQTEIGMNNIGVLAYAAANGVPVSNDTSGFSLGIKQVQRGKDFMDLIENPRVSKDKRIA